MPLDNALGGQRRVVDTGCGGRQAGLALYGLEDPGNRLEVKLGRGSGVDIVGDPVLPSFRRNAPDPPSRRGPAHGSGMGDRGGDTRDAVSRERSLPPPENAVTLRPVHEPRSVAGPLSDRAIKLPAGLMRGIHAPEHLRWLHWDSFSRS